MSEHVAQVLFIFIVQKWVTRRLAGWTRTGLGECLRHSARRIVACTNTECICSKPKSSNEAESFPVKVRDIRCLARYPGGSAGLFVSGLCVLCFG